jgi:hypothetical protein
VGNYCGHFEINFSHFPREMGSFLYFLALLCLQLVHYSSQNIHESTWNLVFPRGEQEKKFEILKKKIAFYKGRCYDSVTSFLLEMMKLVFCEYSCL